MINATTDELMTELISGLSSRPLLGHLVFTLLRVAANEEMKELRSFDKILSFKTNKVLVRARLSSFVINDL